VRSIAEGSYKREQALMKRTRTEEERNGIFGR
jgi:hypothetical protein